MFEDLLDRFFEWADKYDWTTFKTLYEDAMIAVCVVFTVELIILFWCKF